MDGLDLKFQAKRMPRHTQFAVVGADLAVRDAGLSFREVGERQSVVMIGAALMDFGTINKAVELIVRKGIANAIPSSLFMATVSAVSGAIGELIGGRVRSMALQSVCCSGLDAIGHGADMVARGEADIAVCGGTEAPLLFHPMMELKLAGLTAGNPEHPERQCRPFDLWRTTGAIGEGACVVVLEPEESPRPGYAFVTGYAYVSDSRGELCGGLARSAELALANAGLRPGDVECISACGPGHREVDAAEAAALQRVFGARLPSIPAYSIKGAIGNPLGAAPAIQVGCAALGLRDGVLPPTVNWQYPDPACPLNLSPKARFVEHSVTLVDAHGMAGTNACLVIQR
jgi:3-oxoacyl-(acyl-carrier-protein) synthase